MEWNLYLEPLSVRCLRGSWWWLDSVWMMYCNLYKTSLYTSKGLVMFAGVCPNCFPLFLLFALSFLTLLIFFLSFTEWHHYMTGIKSPALICKSSFCSGYCLWLTPYCFILENVLLKWDTYPIRYSCACDIHVGRCYVVKSSPIASISCFSPNEFPTHWCAQEPFWKCLYILSASVDTRHWEVLCEISQFCDHRALC